MSSMVSSKRVNRRTFLRSLGVLAGVALTSSVHSTFAAPGARHASSGVKVGALVPTSSIHPRLNASFTAGMRMGFAQSQSLSGSAVNVNTRSMGVDPSAVFSHARALLQDGTDLTLALLNINMASWLRPLFHASQSTLVVSEAGANVPRADEQSPFVVQHTLGYWQSNWAMGQWAAQNLGRRALIVSSFYESGYDALYTFRLGFELAGGEVVDTVVTHVQPAAENFANAFAAIQHAQPDFVYAMLNGQQAVDFVRAYDAAGLHRQTPLAGSAFLVDENILPRMGGAASGILSAAGWSAGLQSEANDAFTSAYRQRTGQLPDAHALLGYESARLVLAAGDSAGIPLSAATFSSPRGALRMNPATQTSIAPLYLREVRARGGAYENALVSELPSIVETDERLAAFRRTARSGWTNAYLSV